MGSGRSRLLPAASRLFTVPFPAALVKAVEQSAGAPPSGELFESALTAARLAEPHPELLAASSHFLAVGYAGE